MATAGIIHGNDGTKTDGSGGGVDFVEEEEEEKRGERAREREEAWKRLLEARRQFPMHHGCDDRSHSSTDADDGIHPPADGWMDRKQSAGKITQRDRAEGHRRE